MIEVGSGLLGCCGRGGMLESWGWMLVLVGEEVMGCRVVYCIVIGR